MRGMLVRLVPLLGSSDMQVQVRADGTVLVGLLSESPALHRRTEPGTAIEFELHGRFRSRPVSAHPV